MKRDHVLYFSSSRLFRKVSICLATQFIIFFFLFGSSCIITLYQIRYLPRTLYLTVLMVIFQRIVGRECILKDLIEYIDTVSIETSIPLELLFFRVLKQMGIKIIVKEILTWRYREPYSLLLFSFVMCILIDGLPNVQLIFSLF